MTWHTQTVVMYLWWSQPILHSAVAVILWHRKLHKKFPVFFFFLLAQIANFALIYPVRSAGFYELYFWLYWSYEAINAVLGFKVIHEIFVDVFRPYHTLKDLGTLLFKWAGIVMLLVSVVVAFSNSFDQSPLIHAITTLQRSVRIVQLGLILFLLLFSRFLGISRRQASFGIALGFGLFAGMDLVMYVLYSGQFVKLSLLILVNMFAYNLAVCVWLGYSLSNKVSRASGTNHLQTQRWEQGLADLQHPVTTDSLIPMFEGMVDRAFSRSSNLDATEVRVSQKDTPELPRANSAVAGSETRR
jgi:hypothetical protein